MIKRLVAIALSLLVWGGTLSAQAAPIQQTQVTHQKVAEPDGISPRYVLISSIHGNTSVKDGKVWATGTVSGDCTYASVTITLQYFDAGKWQDSTSWSATGKSSATKSASKTATPGLLYRTKIYGYVSKGSVTDSETIYTKVVGA